MEFEKGFFRVHHRLLATDICRTVLNYCLVFLAIMCTPAAYPYSRSSSRRYKTTSRIVIVSMSVLLFVQNYYTGPCTCVRDALVSQISNGTFASFTTFSQEASVAPIWLRQSTLWTSWSQRTRRGRGI